MSEQHQNTTPKKYKRVLIYCSTKEQLDEILSSLPIIDGYWDAFNDLGKAIEAVKNGDYGLKPKTRCMDLWKSVKFAS